MRTITITFDPTPGCGWDVEENGRRCDGLCWGEMLEQVATLTMPPERLGHGYEMRTPDEWAERKARALAGKPAQAVPPLQIEGPTPA